MKRLKATLLQLCLRKDEERKPKPKAAMRVKSWMTVKRDRGVGEDQGRMCENWAERPLEGTCGSIYRNYGVMTTEHTGLR